MALCANCGNEVREGAAFCSKCGKSTAAPAKPPGELEPCRVCGKDVAYSADKCPHCGVQTPSASRLRNTQIGCLIPLGIVLLIIVCVGLSLMMSPEKSSAPNSEPASVAGAEPAASDAAADAAQTEPPQQTGEEASANTPLTLVTDSFGFPSYQTYRNVMDKVARLSQGHELTEEEILNLGLQEAVGTSLPAGTKVTKLEERGEGETLTAARHWAYKVRILNGANVGKTLWIPALADLKDCSVPFVNSFYSQFCNGE